MGEPYIHFRLSIKEAPVCMSNGARFLDRSHCEDERSVQLACQVDARPFRIQMPNCSLHLSIVKELSHSESYYSCHISRERTVSMSKASEGHD